MNSLRELRELPYQARARIADNLLLQRLRAEFSRADLSDRATVSQGRIRRLEDGEIGGQLDTYVRLAGALGITVGDLLAGVRWTPAAIEREVQAGYEVVFEVEDRDKTLHWDPEACPLACASIDQLTEHVFWNSDEVAARPAERRPASERLAGFRSSHRSPA